MVLTTVLSMMRYVSEAEDRDFVDRLHSYFTTNLLIGFSVLVSFKQFGGKPLECLTPDIFTGSWEQYAENYCWAQDTYFVRPNSVVDKIPQPERFEKKISYYQWVPFFLLFKATCFRLPSLYWKYMSDQSGIKIREILKLSKDPNNLKPHIRQANIKSLTIHLLGALRFHRRLQRKQIKFLNFFCFMNLPYSAYFITVIYLITKFCYLCNVFIQLIFLNSFLNTNRYSIYGFGATLDLLNGTTWQQSGMFPRVSLCDFEVRVMGNIQAYTIQCVLVINIFNEKIFVFLWFWYVFLLVFTIGSFFFWLIVFIFPYANQNFIARHLEMSELQIDFKANDKLLNRFVKFYLQCDGVFIIRLLIMHSGVIFGTDLLLALWQNYYGINENQIKKSNSFPEIFYDNFNDPEHNTILHNNFESNTNKINDFLFSDKIHLRNKKLILPSLPSSEILRAVVLPSNSTVSTVQSFSKNQYSKSPKLKKKILFTQMPFLKLKNKLRKPFFNDVKEKNKNNLEMLGLTEFSKKNLLNTKKTTPETSKKD